MKHPLLLLLGDPDSETEIELIRAQLPLEIEEPQQDSNISEIPPENHEDSVTNEDDIRSFCLSLAPLLSKISQIQDEEKKLRIKTQIKRTISEIVAKNTPQTL